MQLDLAPAWMVAVIIGRELAVTGAAQPRLDARARVPASPLGKIKMVSQVMAILLLILGQNGTQPFFIARPGRAVGGGGARRSCRRLDYYRAFARP